MKQIIVDVLQASVTGTLAFALLLACKRSILKRCGVTFWHNALLIVSILFVFPWRLPAMTLSPLVHPVRVWLTEFTDVFNKNQGTGITRILLPNTLVFKAVLLLWVLGITIYVIIRVLLYLIFAHRIKVGSQEVSNHVWDVFHHQVANEGHLKRLYRLTQYRLYVHDDFLSPLVFGFFRKTIILPAMTIDNYDDHEIHLMLRHELIHITHHDVWKRLFLLIVHALNWFNPIMFLLHRQMNEALELYCDQETLARHDDVQARQQYGDLLISLLDNHNRRAVMGMLMASKNFIKERMIYVMMPVKKADKLMSAIFSSLLAIVVGACLLGFSVQHNYEVELNRLSLFDDGETTQFRGWETLDVDDRECFFLTEQGEYIFEDIILSGDEYFIPMLFVTNSTRIKVSLLTGTDDIRVYLYNSEDKSYPLMQLFLDHSTVSESFLGLGGSESYALSVFANDAGGKTTRISIQD